MNKDQENAIGLGIVSGLLYWGATKIKGMRNNPGYNWEKGKSNNAVQAEEDGLMNATNLAKWARKWIPGITAKDVREVLEPSEWHHTSKKFNKTDYYDPADLANMDNRNALREFVKNRKLIQKMFKALPKNDKGEIEVLLEDGKLWHWITKEDIEKEDQDYLLERLEPQLKIYGVEI